MQKVCELATAGFFAQAKTVAETQSHLEEKTGYRYGPGDLYPTFTRLLRDGTLKRETRPSGGQYEYSAK